MKESVSVSLHARLVAGRNLGSAVADAIDSIVAPEPPAGPLQTEVLQPLTAAAAEVDRLRSGRLGSLTLEQRQALNLIHGRLSHVGLVLREMESGSPIPAAEVVLAPDPAL